MRAFAIGGVADAMNAKISEIFEALSTNSTRASLALALVALLCFLPGFFSLPAVDRDEARYAQATRQMVASGDWIDIRLQEKPRHKQPAGIYWAQSLFVSILGEDGIAPIWVHRLPSLLAATFAVLLTYWIALPMVGSGPALLAGLTMAVSLILGVEARMAKTDATLLATTLAAQGALARAYLSWKGTAPEAFSGKRAWLLPWLFWTALAAGALVKGPLILLFVGLTVVALSIMERSGAFLARLRPVPGVFWFLLLVLPWYVAIGLRTDGVFYDEAIGFSVVGKITQSHEGHGGPPLTHLAWFWGIFWPGSILFALSLVGIWKRRKEPWVRFLICWAVPAWVAFELITTKLPHYLLPVFPAISIAAAGVLSARGTIAQGRVSSAIVVGIFAMLGVFAVVASATAAWFAVGEKLSPAFVAVSAVALLLFVYFTRWGVRSLRKGEVVSCYASLVVAMVAFYWLTAPFLAHNPFFWPAPAVGEIVRQGKKCEEPFLVAAGYHEASLVFYTRTDLLLTKGAEAAERMAENDCAVGVIDKSQLPAFLEKQEELGLVVEKIGDLTGFNIGGGRFLELSVFAKK